MSASRQLQESQASFLCDLLILVLSTIREPSFRVKVREMYGVSKCMLTLRKVRIKVPKNRAFRTTQSITSTVISDHTKNTRAI